MVFCLIIVIKTGETFVTRKITIGLSKIFLGKSKELHLGNLESKRDWGHAKDFAYAMAHVATKTRRLCYINW